MALRFIFDDYELDDERLELRRGGERVDIQPKALSLLIHLVGLRDRVVSKEELLAAIWPGAVVTENSLARAVSLARRAVDDRNPESAIIATVSRRGYRFQAPVRELPPIDSQLEAAATDEGEALDSYVGRERLIARLHASLDSALGGRGRIVILTGESGIGKTRTAEMLGRRAKRSGAAFAAVWGLEAGAGTYWSWRRLLELLVAANPQLLSSLDPGVQRTLAVILPELAIDEPAPLSPATEGDAARFRLFDAVQSLLVRATKRQPITLVIDDLQAADAESLWLLEFLGHWIGSHALVVIATCRNDGSGFGGQHSRATERLLRSTAVERWPLQGLSNDELRAFIRTRLEIEPDDGLVGALQGKTRGNPLLVGESLRSLEARGLLGATRGIDEWEALLPDGIRDLLSPKLRALSAEAIETLATAAAIGFEFGRELLAECLPDATETDVHQQELTSLGLITSHRSAVGRSSFTHPLIHEVLYAELLPPGDARRSMHGRIFAVIDRHSGAREDTLAERARHAFEASPQVDPTRVASLNRASGRRAVRLHDYDSASVAFQRALQQIEDHEVVDREMQIGLGLDLADAEVQSVGLVHARISYLRTAGQARALERNDYFARAVLGFAHRPVASGGGDAQVVGLLEEAIERLDPIHRSLRVRLQSRLAAELRYSDPARAQSLSDEALDAARRLDEPAVLAQTLDDTSFVRWSIRDPAAWIRLNGELERAAHLSNDSELALRGQKGRVTGYLELGDLAAADREIRACERTATEFRTPYASWLVTSLHAMRMLLEGRLEQADRMIAEGLRLGERLESDEVALELRAQFFYLRLEQGRVSEIEEVVRAQPRLFPEAPVFRAVLGRLLTATGRSTEAHEVLGTLALESFRDVPQDRGWLPTLAVAAEVTHATSDVPLARRLRELLEPFCDLQVVAGSGLLYYGPVHHHLGLLATTVGDWEAAIDHFERALEMELAAGAKAWEARTRLACVRALLGGGAKQERDRAVDQVDLALSSARALDLTQIVGEAHEVQTFVWTHRRTRRA